MVLCLNWLPHAFVWAIYIYIESIEVTCRSTVVKTVLIGNLRWPSSCLYLLYFPATVLFTCIKSWFFRNHLANCHQISHWIYCWNVIYSLFKWLCSIYCQAHIFFFKTKNCSNDDLFISCDDRIGKMLHNICISAVVMSLRWASRGPWASCFRRVCTLCPCPFQEFCVWNYTLSLDFQEFSKTACLEEVYSFSMSLVNCPIFTCL